MSSHASIVARFTSAKPDPSRPGFNIIRRENPCSAVLCPASPPIGLVVRSLRDGDDVALLKTEIALLVGVKGV